MKLLLVREKPVKSGQTFTHGKLYQVVDGHPNTFVCYTLEDQVRPDNVKINGKTAIPAGIYNVSVTMSTRFKKELPLLANVPNFSGVRIHGGNTDADSIGCVLVGGFRHDTGISNCAPFVSLLTKMIKQAGTCKLEIRNP